MPIPSGLKAIDLMREHNISCLPVVGDQGELVGILTEREIREIVEKLRTPVNKAVDGVVGGAAKMWGKAKGAAKKGWGKVKAKGKVSEVEAQTVS